MKTRLLVALLSLTSLASLAEPASFSVAPKPRGFVRFTIEGPLDDVVGETRVMSGTFTVDPKAWAGGKGTFAVDLNTVRTGIDQRDEDMRLEFLETKRFPFAILSLDTISQANPASLQVGASASAQATGSFEVHGVRRAISLPIKVRLESETRMVASGSFSVSFADYSIARPQRLFLKLGDTADVSFEVAFVPRPPPVVKDTAAQPVAEAPVPTPTPTVAQVQPAGPKPKAKPKRKVAPALVFAYLFKGDEPKAKGEKLFHSPETGGPSNKMTCYHCHAKTDERESVVLKDNTIRAATSLFNAAQRPKFWGGFASTAGSAASICQKQFMKGSGLSATQEQELQAFIEAISPDAAPALDYAGNNYRSMESLLRDPTAGDVTRGKALADKYCMTCHLEGRVGPVWALGLYEPDWVVRRVRRLEGHQNKQMPPWTITRLPDSDLRDIVTYLTSTPAVFQRKKAAITPAAGAP